MKRFVSEAEPLNESIRQVFPQQTSNTMGLEEEDFSTEKRQHNHQPQLDDVYKVDYRRISV